MPNQWDNLFKNEGTWNGSFTQLTPDGSDISDVPSCLTLKRTSANSGRFRLTRYPTDQPPQETTVALGSLSQNTLFCDDGSFSRGPTQWHSTSSFSTEFGLTLAHARLRLVQFFDARGDLSRLVLIRETRDGTPKIVRPMLTVDQLLGTWRGQAITYGSDSSVSQPMAIELTVEQDSAHSILQTWRAEMATGQSQAQINGARLIFEQTGYQLLFLPNGGSSLCPQTIPQHTAFRCEIGWLVEPNLRLRLTREYRADGSWTRQTWIQEERVG